MNYIINDPKIEQRDADSRSQWLERLNKNPALLQEIEEANQNLINRFENDRNEVLKLCQAGECEHHTCKIKRGEIEE